MNWKNACRKTLKWTGFGAAVLVLCVAFLFGIVQTESGRQGLVRIIERLLDHGRQKIELGRVTGVIPFHFKLDRLTLGDGEGAWFILAGLEVDWSPSSLFRGHIHVREMRSASLDVRRLPSGRAEKGEAGRLPRWIGAFEHLRVDRLALDELVLGEAVLGEKAVFRMEGNLKAALPGSEWATRLVLERKDGPEARLLLDGTLGENGRFLRLEVDGREAARGLLSRYARIEGPVAFAIHGKGPLADWKGRMELGAGGAGKLQAEIRLQFAEEIRLGLEGTAEQEEGAFSELLGSPSEGRIRFSMSGAIGKDRQIQIERLSVDTKDAELRFSGLAGLAEGTLRGNFRIRHDDLSRTAKALHLPLRGKAVVEGAISGKVLRPSVDLALESGDLAVERVGLQQLRGDFHLDVADGEKEKGPVLRLRGEGRMKGLSLKGADWLPERDPSFGISLERPFSAPIRLKHLRLKGERNSLLLSGEIHPGTGVGRFGMEADTKDLMSLSKRLGLGLSGTGRLKGAIEGEFKTLSFSAEIHGELKPDVPDHPMLRPLFKEGIEWSAKLAVEQGRKLAVTNVRLSSPLASLTAGGNLDLVAFQGTASGRLQFHDLRPLSSIAGAPLGGALQMNVTAEGSPDRMTIRTDLQGREILFKGVPLGDSRLALDAAGAALRNQGSLRFAAGGVLEGVSGEAKFGLINKRLSLSGIRLSGPGTSNARGNLEIDLDRRLSEGKIEAECRDLGAFSALADQTLRGRAALKAELARINNVQHLRLSVTGTHLEAAALDAEELTVQAALTDLWDMPRGNASLEGRDLASKGFRVSSLSLNTKGNAGEISFSAKANGEAERTFSFAAEGLVRPHPGSPFLRVDRFRGQYGALPFRIAGPVSVERSEDGVSSSITAALGDGRMNCSGRLGLGRIDLFLRVENLPLDPFRPAGAPSMEGRISAELALKGALSGPQATASLRIIDLRAHGPQLKEVPPAILEARADLQGQRLKCEFVLRNVTSKPFSSVVDVPLRLSLDPFAASFPSGEDVKGRLDGQADLARLGNFLGLDNQSIGGLADVALRLEGTPAHPVVNGRIVLDKGSYENARSGTVLKDINIAVAAGTRGLVIERAAGGDGEEGAAKAEGWLEINPGAGFPFLVDVDFQKMKILRHDWLSANGSGRVQMKGSFSHALLKGEVQVESGEFRIPDHLAPDTPALEVVEINGKGPAERKRAESTRTVSPFLDFDLGVKSAGHFFVKGRGLESEWRGGLRIAGPENAPLITGELSVEKGRFNFLDRRFTLTQGRITFNGLARSSPFMEVTAESSTRDLTAHLDLVGPINAPEIKLSSEPPLPTDEVISHLLFGQGVSRISPMQALQLARALSMLSGKQTLDLLGTTQKWLKIDQLDVRQSKQAGDSSEQTSISAGKYIRDNVYLELEQQLGAAGTKASVEWEITPHISIETEVGANAGSGLGVNWKWDY